jgi:DUF4097 and DUF4098 domain-containing protein YvlB
MTTGWLTRWPQRTLAAGALVLASGCGLQLSLNAEARDEWKRSYTLAKDGAFEIRETNGRIEIQATEGNAVEVIGTRIVKAATDEAAKDALKRLEITENVTPDRISLDTTGHGVNLQMGLSVTVNFVVRLPRTASVKLVATNGDIDITDVGGTLDIHTTNGQVKTSRLAGSATVESTNGAIALDFVKLGDAGITCETTNGKIEVSIPKDSKARISARVTNGAITTSNLEITTTEQTHKRVEGTIGGGGAPIRLETTNGLVEIRGR